LARINFMELDQSADLVGGGLDPEYPDRGARMTTSQETDWMDHPAIRALIDRASELAIEERITVVKGLIPGIADALSEEEYEQFVTFIRLKGERYFEAKAHPGQGRAERHTPGERELEGR
jgi:hypothetical protein